MPDTRDIPMLVTIYKVYEQQKYMYQNRVHSVPECIVSLSQPWVHLTVRGKGVSGIRGKTGSKHR